MIYFFERKYFARFFTQMFKNVQAPGRFPDWIIIAQMPEKKMPRNWFSES